MKNNICNLLELYLDDKTGNLTWILRGIIAPYCLFMSRVHICGCWLDSLNPYEAIVYIANLGARGGATRAPDTSLFPFFYFSTVNYTVERNKTVLTNLGKYLSTREQHQGEDATLHRGAEGCLELLADTWQKHAPEIMPGNIINYHM